MARGQNGTKQDTPVRELTPEQELAIMALVEGLTDAEAGERAGVARSTVARWKSSDALFVASLGAARKALWQAHIDGMRALLAEARRVVAGALASEDEKLAFTAAVTMLKFADLGKELEPVDPTTVTGVESRWKNEAFFEFVG